VKEKNLFKICVHPVIAKSHLFEPMNFF